MRHTLLPSQGLILYFTFSTQVFSFLDPINLCRAAMVCRQWRAASAHEDFWRCLNFENRNISVEQCEFDLVPSANSFTLSSSCIWVEYCMSVKRCGFEKPKGASHHLLSLTHPSQSYHQKALISMFFSTELKND
jgi:hypothetical protein